MAKLMGKGSKSYSILKMKCPRCQEGEFFVSHAYDIKNAGNLHERCSKCNLKYEKEPGFFQGAMYVSYGLGVALFVTLWVSFNLFFPSMSTGFQVTVVVVSSIVLTPIMYAFSKIIWVNLFNKYEGTDALAKEKSTS
ncbi:MAG: DUF983 domain-containing protein [Crocinitomicaceae bacterium]|nr:DUF983 domain-containing protein [Flavobacteriales bacterium]NQZ35353.1 DUF983 domain-containing protein [Crocinitomicaceae bacterium]